MQILILITKGILRDASARRKVMGATVLAACVLLFAGSTFLERALQEHPLCFLAFWGIFAWLTVLSVLMALYDLLHVRAVARRDRDRMKRGIFGEENERDDR